MVLGRPQRRVRPTPSPLLGATRRRPMGPPTATELEPTLARLPRRPRALFCVPRARVLWRVARPARVGVPRVAWPGRSSGTFSRVSVDEDGRPVVEPAADGGRTALHAGEVTLRAEA